MINLIIVGAGSMGRQLYSWLSQEIEGNPKYKIRGFLDNNSMALEPYNLQVGIINSIQNYQPLENDSLVFGIADPLTREKLINYLLDKGCKFHTFIHSSAIIGINVQIGTGTVIFPGCIVNNDTVLEDFVFLNVGVTLGHDVNIGKYCSINTRSVIAGFSVLEEKCFVGVNATIIPKTHIGNNSTIGAGSVVIKNVEAGTTVVGNPARKLIK